MDVTCMGNYFSTLHLHPTFKVSVRSGVSPSPLPLLSVKTCPATPYPLTVQLRHGCNMYGQLFLNPTFASHSHCVCKNGVSLSLSSLLPFHPLLYVTPLSDLYLFTLPYVGHHFPMTSSLQSPRSPTLHHCILRGHALGETRVRRYVVVN